jgi:hypothetical protein
MSAPSFTSTARTSTPSSTRRSTATCSPRASRWSRRSCRPSARCSPTRRARRRTRRSAQERGRDQEDRGVRPVELLPGEEQQAEPGGARRDARDRRGRRPHEARGRALQGRERGHPQGSRAPRGGGQGGQRQERRVDARPPPVGAGDDAHPDRDLARRDHPAHAEALAPVHGLRLRASAGRCSRSPPRCIFDAEAKASRILR